MNNVQTTTAQTVTTLNTETFKKVQGLQSAEIAALREGDAKRAQKLRREYMAILNPKPAKAQTGTAAIISFVQKEVQKEVTRFSPLFKAVKIAFREKFGNVLTEQQWDAFTPAAFAKSGITVTPTKATAENAPEMREYTVGQMAKAVCLAIFPKGEDGKRQVPAAFAEEVKLLLCAE